MKQKLASFYDDKIIWILNKYSQEELFYTKFIKEEFH